MKVKELIEELQELDPEMKVVREQKTVFPEGTLYRLVEVEEVVARDVKYCLHKCEPFGVRAEIMCVIDNYDVSYESRWEG